MGIACRWVIACLAIAGAWVGSARAAEVTAAAIEWDALEDGRPGIRVNVVVDGGEPDAAWRLDLFGIPRAPSRVLTLAQGLELEYLVIGEGWVATPGRLTATALLGDDPIGAIDVAARARGLSFWRAELGETGPPRTPAGATLSDRMGDTLRPAIPMARLDRYRAILDIVPRSRAAAEFDLGLAARRALQRDLALVFFADAARAAPDSALYAAWLAEAVLMSRVAPVDELLLVEGMLADRVAAWSRRHQEAEAGLQGQLDVAAAEIANLQRQFDAVRTELTARRDRDPRDPSLADIADTLEGINDQIRGIDDARLRLVGSNSGPTNFVLGALARLQTRLGRMAIDGAIGGRDERAWLDHAAATLELGFGQPIRPVPPDYGHLAQLNLRRAERHDAIYQDRLAEAASARAVAEALEADYSETVAALERQRAELDDMTASVERRPDFVTRRRAIDALDRTHQRLMANYNTRIVEAGALEAELEALHRRRAAVAAAGLVEIDAELQDRIDRYNALVPMLNAAADEANGIAQRLVDLRTDYSRVVDAAATAAFD
ncbi:MAG: hypothetical protein V3R98_07925, partial [Alphaproteobacteria bacterium]